MIDWMESKSVDSEAYIRSLYYCTDYIMWSMVDWIGSYSRNSEANTCALYISLASALDQSAFASPILVHVCLCTYVVTSSLCIWILVLFFLLCTCTDANVLVYCVVWKIVSSYCMWPWSKLYLWQDIAHARSPFGFDISKTCVSVAIDVSWKIRILTCLCAPRNWCLFPAL